MMRFHSKSNHAVHEAVRSVFPLLQIVLAMILLATSTASPSVSLLSSAHVTHPSSSSFISFLPSVDVAVNPLSPVRCYSVVQCSQIARAAATTAFPSIPVEDEEEQQPSVVKQCRTTQWFGGFISTTSCDLVPAPIEEEDMVPMPAPVDVAVDPLLPVRCYSVAHCSQIARTAFAAATTSSSSSIPVEEEQIPSVDEHCRTTQWFGGFISITNCDPVPSSSSSSSPSSSIPSRNTN